MEIIFPCSHNRYIISVVVSLVFFIWKTPHAYEWQRHSSQFLSEVLSQFETITCVDIYKLLPLYKMGFGL